MDRQIAKAFEHFEFSIPSCRNLTMGCWSAANGSLLARTTGRASNNSAARRTQGFFINSACRSRAKAPPGAVAAIRSAAGASSNANSKRIRWPINSASACSNRAARSGLSQIDLPKLYFAGKVRTS